MKQEINVKNNSIKYYYQYELIFCIVNIIWNLFTTIDDKKTG